MSDALHFYRLEHAPFEDQERQAVAIGTRPLRDTLARLHSELESGRAVICVDGPAGIGKTYLLLALAGQLSRNAKVATLPRGDVAPRKLKQVLARSFGLPDEHLSADALGAQRESSRLAVLVDNAERMPTETIFAIESLLRHAGPSGRPHVQCVLVAHLESVPSTSGLIGALSRLDASTVELGPIPAEEIGDYIQRRLDRAGYCGQPLFSRDAAQQVHRLAKGRPRGINRICGEALELGAAAHTDTIGAELVMRARESLRRRSSDDTTGPRVAARQDDAEDGASARTTPARARPVPAVPRRTTPPAARPTALATAAAAATTAQSPTRPARGSTPPHGTPAGRPASKTVIGAVPIVRGVPSGQGAAAQREPQASPAAAPAADSRPAAGEPALKMRAAARALRSAPACFDPAPGPSPGATPGAVPPGAVPGTPPRTAEGAGIVEGRGAHFRRRVVPMEPPSAPAPVAGEDRAVPGTAGSAAASATPPAPASGSWPRFERMPDAAEAAESRSETVPGTVARGSEVRDVAPSTGTTSALAAPEASPGGAPDAERTSDRAVVAEAPGETSAIPAVAMGGEIAPHAMGTPARRASDRLPPRAPWRSMAFVSGLAGGVGFMAIAAAITWVAVRQPAEPMAEADATVREARATDPDAAVAPAATDEAGAIEVAAADPASLTVPAEARLAERAPAATRAASQTAPLIPTSDRSAAEVPSSDASPAPVQAAEVRTRAATAPEPQPARAADARAESASVTRAEPNPGRAERSETSSQVASARRPPASTDTFTPSIAGAQVAVADTRPAPPAREAAPPREVPLPDVTVRPHDAALLYPSLPARIYAVPSE